MPEVRTIRNRGAFMVVEAHGEVLFTERGDVANFTRRLSNNARRFAAQEAPANKRPRWSHYGPSLKNSFRASTDADPARLRVDAAIGSTAHYAEFVDQGTKPFLAKILPPWAPRYPFLYEHTWVSPVTGERAGRIPVKGQRGRFFFEKGLHRAFLTAGMASAVVPFEPGRMATFPERLANFVGATPVDDAFKAQLDEWRSQRNAAWGAFVRDRDRPFRPTRSRATTSPERKKELSAARSRKYRRSARYRNARDAARAAREGAKVANSAAEESRRRRERMEAEKAANARRGAQKAAEARAIRDRAIAIRNERAELLSDARAKYKGYIVSVGERTRHNGTFSYRLSVRKSGSVREIVHWIPSDYQ